MSKEQDTDQAAMAGKLGRCESQVQELFFRVDREVTRAMGAVDRMPIKVSGEWTGRSYRRPNGRFLRIDLKTNKLRLWVGEALYREAPAALRGNYRQKDWLVADAATEAVLFAYLPKVFAVANRATAE